MRGRKPTPTQLKILRGNPGNRPLNANEPLVDCKVPKCPKVLSALAKKEWRRVTRELANAAMITELDMSALATYCEAWADWTAAREKVAVLGHVVLSPNNFPVSNPYADVASRAFKQMRALWPELGLTPSARTRIHVRSASPAEETDESFLFGAKR